MPSQVTPEEAEDNNEILLKPCSVSATITAANGDGTRSQMLPQPNHTPGLFETPGERRARRRSHWIVYITTFVMSIGFSIVLTGVWPYLQKLDPGTSKEFLGWVIAANPLGQMLASPLMGVWSNKAGSNRGAFLFTVFIFIIGNIVYAILNVFGGAARAVMVFSRFLVGISSANIAIIRSYIAASTTLTERTSAVALTSAAQGLGFIIGPAIQTGLALLLYSKSPFLDSHPESSAPAMQNVSAIQSAVAVAFSYERNTSNSTINLDTEIAEEMASLGIEWNMYTATGWVAVLLGVINLFLFLPCCFQEYPIAAKEAQYRRQAMEEENVKLPKPDYIALVGVLVAFFFILFLYVLLETLLVPMCIDLYAWTNEMAITVVGIGLSIAGTVAVIMFALTGFLTKKFDERKVFIFLGLVPLAVSMLIHFPMGSTYPKMQNCTSHEPATLESPTTLLSDLLGLNITGADGFNATEPNEILIRKRRYSAREDGACLDTGCPQEQAWCLYTPIIEKPQMIVAELVAIIGYPVSFTLSSALFSKLLGPKPQGLWMGILTSTGSFSRVTGPIFVSYMYTALGTRWTFGVLFVIVSMTLIMVSVLYKRLVPMKLSRSG